MWLRWVSFVLDRKTHKRFVGRSGERLDGLNQLEAAETTHLLGKKITQRQRQEKNQEKLDKHATCTESGLNNTSIGQKHVESKTKQRSIIHTGPKCTRTASKL